MRLSCAALCVSALCVSAHAQFYTGFELPDFIGSPTGVLATGQQGWYQPVATGSDDHNIHTYSGNSLGLVQNPVGGNQFIGGLRDEVSAVRAQHDIGFTPGAWTVAYDFAVNFLGTAPSFANLGSFSLQHDTAGANNFKGFIALKNFVDNADPFAGAKLEMNVSDAAGGVLNGVSPGAAWANLQVNNWYRHYITFDLTSNAILDLTLVNLHTGASSSASPDWYLTGGTGSTLPDPNGVRAFVSGQIGNTIGWDNITAVPAPGAMGLLGTGLVFAARRRRR